MTVFVVYVAGGVKGHPTRDDATFRYLSQVYTDSVSSAASSPLCSSQDEGKSQLSLSFIQKAIFLFNV